MHRRPTQASGSPVYVAELVVQIGNSGCVTSTMPPPPSSRLLEELWDGIQHTVVYQLANAV